MDGITSSSSEVAELRRMLSLTDSRPEAVNFEALMA